MHFFECVSNAFDVLGAIPFGWNSIRHYSIDIRHFGSNGRGCVDRFRTFS